MISLIPEFDKTKLGSTTNSNSAKLGFFFASNKNNAAKYANLVPIKYKENTIYVGSTSDAKRFYDYYISAKNGVPNDDAVKFIKDPDYIPNEGEDIEPDFYYPSDKELELKELDYYELEQIELLNNTSNEQEINEIKKELKSIENKRNILLNTIREENEKEFEIQLEKIKLKAKEQIPIFEEALEKALKSDTGKFSVEEIHLVEDGENPFDDFYEEHADIKEVFLNIKDLDVRDDKGKKFSDGSYTKQFKLAKDKGKDGAVRKNTLDPLFTDVYIVFNPNQIKSATDNTGTFSQEDDNIYHSSITEYVPTIPSVEIQQSQLPLTLQHKYADRIDTGEIEISCRL